VDEPLGLFVGRGLVDVLARVADGVEVPARVHGTSDDATVTFYTPEGTVAWEYPASEFVDILQRAILALPQ
jgi:hypothetical protein